MPSEKEIEVGAEIIYHHKNGISATDFAKLPHNVKRAYRQDSIDILTAVEEVRWRPIETAPKDGTTIILYNKFYSYLPIGKWDILESGDECGNNTIYAWHVSENFNAMGDGILSEDEDIMPTHWLSMPLEV